MFELIVWCEVEEEVGAIPGVTPVVSYYHLMLGTVVEHSHVPAGAIDSFDDSVTAIGSFDEGEDTCGYSALWVESMCTVSDGCTANGLSSTSVSRSDW